MKDFLQQASKALSDAGMTYVENGFGYAHYEAHEEAGMLTTTYEVTVEENGTLYGTRKRDVIPPARTVKLGAITLTVNGHSQDNVKFEAHCTTVEQVLDVLKQIRQTRDATGTGPGILPAGVQRGANGIPAQAG